VSEYQARARSEMQMAVKILNAWMAPGQLTQPGEPMDPHDAVLRLRAFEYIDQLRRDEGNEAVISGLIALSRALVRDLARERGAESEAAVRETARGLLREIAARAPG